MNNQALSQKSQIILEMLNLNIAKMDVHIAELETVIESYEKHIDRNNKAFKAL